MRELLNFSMTPAAIAKELGLPPSSMDPHTALVEAGLIEPDDHPSRYRHVPGVDRGDSRDFIVWRLTVAGTALAKARIGKPMKRAKADALVSDLLRRVEEVNEDPDSPFEVVSVEVFGSYADRTRAELGDVDLRLLYRAKPGTDLDAANKAAVARAEQADRSLSNFDYLGWLIERDFQSRLRGRSNRFDIQFDREKLHPLPPGTDILPLWPDLHAH